MDTFNNEKQICTTCNGYGLIENTPTPCKKCYGRLCMYCDRKGGCEIDIYTECSKCLGTGYKKN